VSPEYYQTLTTAQKKLFWRSNPLNGLIQIHLPYNRALTMYCENDDTVVKELYWTKFEGWESTSLWLWYRLWQSFYVKRILDIGCYSGIYSLLAASASASNRVTAFDIQKKCILRVEKNAQLNSIKTIKTEQKACSDFSGEVNYYFYEEPEILSSVASLVPKKINNLNASVQSIRLDDYIFEGGNTIPVSLIKIDVEDAELKAIRGLEKTLNRWLPDLLLEINNDTSINHVMEALPKAYQIFSIDEKLPRIKKTEGIFKRFPGSRNFMISTRSSRSLEDMLI
jgi:FkbM family methyltransferase